MASSTNPDHFFQSSHALAESRRKRRKARNGDGRPIQLSSKILALVADSESADSIYLAESAGVARRLVLDGGTTTHTYRGPEAPLTCLAIAPHRPSSHDPSRRTTTDGSRPKGQLFAGCWDKTIWSWDLEGCQVIRRYRGHTDFVKAVEYLYLSTAPLLISGGADALIIIWNVDSGSTLFTLRGHSRGILDLAIDPASCEYGYESHDEDTNDMNTNNTNNNDLKHPHSIILFSASSTPEIRRWAISTDLKAAVEIDPEHPVIVHDTSVNALRFDADDDLWTASSDGSTKCLSRESNWQVDTMLSTTNTHAKGSKIQGSKIKENKMQESNYVRCLAIDNIHGYIITVGRDEDVHVWDRATATRLVTYKGHFDEITTCAVIPGRGRRSGHGNDSNFDDHVLLPEPESKIIQVSGESKLSEPSNAQNKVSTTSQDSPLPPQGPRVVTAGIDRTVRIWSLLPQDVKSARDTQDNADTPQDEDDNDEDDDDDDHGEDNNDYDDNTKQHRPPHPPSHAHHERNPVLTIDEERELAELMEDDDDDES